MKCYICPISRLPILDGDKCIVVWLQAVKNSTGAIELLLAPITYDNAVFDDGDLRGVEPEQPFMVLHNLFFDNLCSFMQTLEKTHPITVNGYRTRLLNESRNKIVSDRMSSIKSEKINFNKTNKWFEERINEICLPQYLENLYHIDAIMGNVGIFPTQSYVGSYDWFQKLDAIIDEI